MQSENISQIIKDAYKLEQDGQYKSSIELLYQGLNKEPDNVEIMAQIAFLYSKLKNYEIAKEYVLKALTKDKNSVFAQKVLIGLYLDTEDKQQFLDFISELDINVISESLLNVIFKGFIQFNLYKEAILLYEKLSRTDRCDDETLYYFALCNYFLKDYEKAKTYALKSLEKNSANYDSQILLANIAYKDKEYNIVEQVLSNIPDNQKNEHVYYLLGMVELQGKHYQVAVDYFSQSLNLNDKNKDCLFALANAYYFLGWFDEALKILAKAKLVAPQNLDILYLNAEIYFLQEKYELALKLLTVILNMDAQNMNAKLLLANIYIKKDLFELARTQLNNILSVNPDNVEALKLYYQVCFAFGWQEQTIATLEKILVLEPENIEYMCKLAESFCLQNKFEDAKVVVQKIFELSEDYEFAYDLAIKIYFKLGEYQRVENIAKKWIKVNPNSDYAHFALAKVYFDGDLKNALEEIMSALKLNPSEEKYYIFAGNIYENLKNLDNAYQYYNEAFEISQDKQVALKLLEIAINKDDETLAEKTYNKIRKIAPFDLNMAFCYVDYLNKIANIKKALEILKALEHGLHDKDLKVIVKAKMLELKK